MKDFFAHWEIPAEFVCQTFLYSSLSNQLSKKSGLSLADLELLCVGVPRTLGKYRRYSSKVR